MLTLGSPVTDLKGIGPAKAQSLKKLNITHLRDFLFHFPTRYEDFSRVTPVKDLVAGTEITVKGQVKSARSAWGFQGKRRLLRVYADIDDGTGLLHVTWFNLRFLEQQLRPGREIFVAGKVELNKQGEYSMRSPALEFGDQDGRVHTGAITPIYSETAGVSSRFLRYQIKHLLPLINTIPEYLPPEIIADHQLIPIQQALTAIHFPADHDQQQAAARRLRFDELFFLQLAAFVRRQLVQKAAAPSITVTKKALHKYIADLPFTLTNAQSNVLAEVIADIRKPHPMNRLLQGDVGSGKSAIALLTTKVVLSNNYDVAYLAPTEILARQQAALLQEKISNHDVHLLVGAMSAAEKKRVKDHLKADKACCVVGTHALLQDDVIISNLGLIIIDEQHRFGVSQRAALSAQTNSQKERPHLLSMTATPIPRTLNLTVFGDLDVSVIDELPAGRLPITTAIIPPHQRDQAIIHALEEIHAGRQVYVIAPLVTDSDKLALKSATATYQEMQRLFPGVAIGLLHGQLPAEDKAGIMRNFAAGAIQLLVATAVVEVGVNVPNATIMIIEGAERFGLAQLHQIRGRIGRGQHKSTCYLFPTTDTAAHSPRLKILTQTTDGFIIAEEDLKLRGPGEVYGTQQSGYTNLKVASLLDYPTIKIARASAEKILAKDPTLASYPILQKKVAQKNLQTHFE